MVIKAALLDMDGVLVDSEPLHCKAWAETTRTIDLNLPPEFFAKYVGIGNDQVAKDLKERSKTIVSIDEIIQRKTDRYLQMIRIIKPNEGVKELLVRLRKNHLYLALVSSSPRQEVVATLQYAGIFSNFDVIIAKEDARQTKPAPDLYKAALKKLNMLPTECIAIEDSETGVASAKSAGVYCIAIPHKLSQNHNFTKADLVIENISVLLGESYNKMRTKNPIIGKLLG